MLTNCVRPKSLRRIAACLITLLALASASFAVAVQHSDSPDRKRAMEMWEKQNFVEAVPLLEKVSVENPRDIEVLSKLGFALYASTAAVKDPEARKQIRDHARTVLLRSNELGDNSTLTRITLQALSSNDATEIPFSNIRDAERAIREGEDAFAHGDFDKAIEAYKRALAADPNLYDAALYTGDVYFKKGYAERDAATKQNLLEQSGEWFKRAIEIDPDRETAYRYWGDALMLAGKKDEARDMFIAAIVASPGEDRAYVGLTQWAQKIGVQLAHPAIEVPTSVTPLKDGKMTINLDPKMLGDKNQPEDGSGAWMMYGLTRAAWATDKFAKEFPAEKAYRHTVREETEALHTVAEMARQQMKDGKIKNLNPSLVNLIKLDDAGLLEPYIFYARPDRDIVKDYISYRRAHRDKLIRYWAEFVVRAK
jgi:tetratricopeptide (TPR) repeat protein